jgi:hypothetical protein
VLAAAASALPGAPAGNISFMYLDFIRNQFSAPNTTTASLVYTVNFSPFYRIAISEQKHPQNPRVELIQKVSTKRSLSLGD